MVYGQNKLLGEHLHRLVINRPNGTRSTQSVSIIKLINNFGFKVICPPDKSKAFLIQLLTNYNRRLVLTPNDIKTIQDI